MKKIRIVHIINDLLPGGAQRVVLDIARNLDKERFESHVIAFRSGKDVGQGKGDLQGRFIEHGISFEILGWKDEVSLRDFWGLVKTVKRYGPDVAHLHLPYSIIVGSVASWLSGVGVRIGHEHNTHEFDPWKVRLLRKVTNPLISLVICYTDIVEESIFGKSHVFMKQSDNGLLDKRSRSITIFNGIDVKMLTSIRGSLDRVAKRTSLGIKEGELFLLATGRLISWKGHEHLIRAFALVCAERQDIQLRIAGYGPFEKRLHTLIRQLSLENNVALLGLRNDTHELLVSADIFSNVHTYKKETVVKEALGIAGLEALASGTATIVGHYLSADKFVKDQEDAFLVDPLNENALKRAICILADNPSLRDKLGKNAMKNMQETFDWSKVARRYEEVYTLLCK